MAAQVHAESLMRAKMPGESIKPKDKKLWKKKAQAFLKRLRDDEDDQDECV